MKPRAKGLRRSEFRAGRGAGRLATLTKLAERIVAGNRAGDFEPLFKAYEGVVPKDRLKASWEESIREIGAEHGRVLRHEVLGSARTEDRDETVVRFHCEKGFSQMTYVWDLEKEGRLLGRSVRGLTVRMRLFASSPSEVFTWDGGVVLRRSFVSGPSRAAR